MSKARAKVGDTVRIYCLAPDSDGSEDPQGDEYRGREGVVQSVDSLGSLHGTWGGLALLPEDSYVVIKPA